MKNPWQITSEKRIYSNPWITLTEFDVINPSGGEGIYGKVHFKNLALGIIALDTKQNIWLVGQYRFPIDRYSWEIPEGGGPTGEDPLESAKRELKEETGIVAQKWTQLMEMDVSNSVTDEVAIVYVAEELEFFEASPEETEELEIKKIALTDAIQMIDSGEIRDAITIAALLKLNYQLNLRP